MKNEPGDKFMLVENLLPVAPVLTDKDIPKANATRLTIGERTWVRNRWLRWYQLSFVSAYLLWRLKFPAFKERI